MRAVLLLILATSHEPHAYDEAYREAKASDKKLMVIFITDFCVPCNRIKAKLNIEKFKHDSINQQSHLYDNYVILFAHNKKLTKATAEIYAERKVDRFPTTVIIDPKSNKYVETTTGFKAWTKYLH